MLRSALLGGTLIGVWSVLPFFSQCCCLWVPLGGVLTAYLLQEASESAITVGDGAVAGLLAGIVGAILEAVLSVPVYFLVAPFRARLIGWVLSTGVGASGPFGSLPVSEQPTVLGAVSQAFVGLLAMLLVGAIFATIGGMVGAALFARRRAPVEPPPLPPSES